MNPASELVTHLGQAVRLTQEISRALSEPHLTIDERIHIVQTALQTCDTLDRASQTLLDGGLPREAYDQLRAMSQQQREQYTRLLQGYQEHP